MSVLESLVLVLHLLVAAAVCGFVLLQHGKGADMGAAFGSGSAGSLFGAAGSANFLSRTTAVLATVFFVTSLALTWFGTTHSGSRSGLQGGVMESLPQPATKSSDVPAAPPGAPATPASGAGKGTVGGTTGTATGSPATGSAAGTVPGMAPLTVTPATGSAVPQSGAPAAGSSNSKAGEVPK